MYIYIISIYLSIYLSIYIYIYIYTYIYIYILYIFIYKHIAKKTVRVPFQLLLIHEWLYGSSYTWAHNVLLM